MPETIRSFIAFDINNQEILKRLAEAQAKLAKTGADLKLVETQNIHVTMRFLGDIQPNMVEKIHGEMKQVAFSPFDVEIRGAGAFPNTKYARVVWAGIQQGADELRNVFNQLEPRLRKLGFRPDSKGFSPHMTIARVRTGRNKSELASCLDELADHEFGILRADCLKLKKSLLTPRGPTYSTLKEVCPK
jgi:2'-5' RNA ligase